jgi:hypothetical protein
MASGASPIFRTNAPIKYQPHEEQKKLTKEPGQCKELVNIKTGEPNETKKYSNPHNENTGSNKGNKI